MKAAWIVYLKEVRENLRDRRALTSALVTGPLLAPLLMTVLIHTLVGREREKHDRPFAVPVIGAENAPKLVESLRQFGLEVHAPIVDPEAAIADQREEVILRIGKTYGEQFRKGEPAEVEVMYDGSRTDGEAAANRLRHLLQESGQRTAALRLVARGLSPLVVSPIAIVDRDLSNARSRAQLLFGMLPYLFVLTIFVGGMYMAIDTTAGERERQSLEPLFANPTTRSRILLGKLGATFTFALLSLSLSLLAFSIVGRFLPTEELGMVLDIGPRFVGRVLLVMLPIVVLLGTLQTLVSAFAKSFREAQTYLSLLMIVPMIPSVLLSILPIKAKLWMFAVPLLGQQLSIMQLVRGESVGTAQTALCFISTLAAGLVVAALTARVYESERLAIST